MNIAPGPPQLPQGPVGKIPGLGTLLRLLTEMPAGMPDLLRMQGRLLSSLLLFLLLSLIVIFPIILTIPAFRNSEQPAIFAISFLFLCLAYGLVRTKYYDWAALFTVSIITAGIWMLAATDTMVDSFVRNLFYLAIPIIFCSLVLPGRATILVTGAQLVSVFQAGQLFPSLISFAQVVSLMVFLSIICVLAVVVSNLRQRDQDEIQRQSISLHQSEERFHLVSYATNDVVWDWDLLTGQVWRNQSAQRLFGFSEDQISPVMLWWETQIHPDEREKVAKSLRAAIDSGETFWSKEYRFRRADASYIYVFDRAYITHDESGKAVRMLGAIMDITARRQAEEVLREESAHDPLTGMFNRRYMEEMFEREISRAERNHQTISVIMLDVDYFKRVNDTLGHAAGDALLRVLGAFLLTYVRGADIACRYGGDEFILILPGASSEIAQQRAGKIREAVGDLTIEPYGDLMGKFTLSLGVAVFPEQGSTRQTILAAADAALYAAKEAGRDRVAVAG